MHLVRFARVFLLLIAFLGTRSPASLAADVNARNAATLSITADAAKEFVGVLADDTFEGRESGSRGNRAAGIYVIERLKKFGIQPGVKDSFYQNFENYHNILGLVEGRDAELKREVIVVSAHYDHVGYGNARNSYGPFGHIHNGADDNASGVAGLLEVARALGQLPEHPRRTILLAFWDGEEKGLLGSKHWIDHPTVPLKQVSFMVNADMIGRLRPSGLNVNGVRTGRGLRQLVSRQNDPANLSINFNWLIKPDSDHYTFYSHDIPILMLHTGMHEDYHRPSDDVEKINTEGLKQISQLIFNIVVELADAPSITGFRRQAKNESQSDQAASERALAPPPARLGLRWDEKAADEGTIKVISVNPNSAAAKAGLKAGDRILKFGGREVSGSQSFQVSVLAAKSPATIVLERSGETEPIELSLDLPGEPVRLGITWRTDDAEPDCVIINRVTPGSLADWAGMRVNDRIYRIGGREFSSGEEFRQLIAATPDSLPLLLDVETAGRIKSVEIAPLSANATQADRDSNKTP